MKHLLRLTLQHEYFDQGDPKNAIGFGQKLLQGLQDYHLKSQGSNGFVYLNTSNPSAVSTAPVSLFIPVEPYDPAFFNYTALDHTPSSVYYLNTDNTTNDILDLSAALKLKVYPSRFVYPLEESQKSDLERIKVKMPNGEEKNWSDFPTGAVIDLIGHEPGKYQVDIQFKDSSKNFSEAIFISEQLSRSPSTPIIIEWKGVVDLNSNNCPMITLRIPARASVWRYYLSGLDEADWQDAKIDPIEINGQTISFLKTPDAQNMPNGSSAYEMVSSVPIPFQERPKWQAKFHSSKTPAGLSLPSATPQSMSIQKDENQNPVYYSDIYVYL